MSSSNLIYNLFQHLLIIGLGDNSFPFYVFIFPFVLVHHHLLYISQSVIAAHDYLVAGVETIDNLVLLGVLTTYLYVHTACHIAAFHHTVYPLGTGLLVEVATGYDDVNRCCSFKY